MQKLAAWLVLALVLASAGVLAQDVGIASGGGGGGFGVPISPSEPVSPGSSGIGSGFIQPQQIAPTSLASGGGFDQPIMDFQTGGVAGQQAGAENVCAIRSGGNDVSCFLARESQNLPIGKGPCQPWETDCRMVNAPQVTTSVASQGQGYCGDGVCTDAERRAGNCCEDCQPGPGCGVGQQGYCGDGFCTEQERMGGQCHDDCGPASQARPGLIRSNAPMATPAPYRPPASPQFSMPTEAFGMPSAGLMIGQFSPAMIRPEGISTEDLIMQKYTRYLKQYVSTDAEQYCNDIPGLVEKATATLKEKAPQLLDITKMCSTIKKQADKCDKFAPQICDQMKKQSGCGEDFLAKCKTEMKKYLGQFADSGQAQSQCEQQWNFRARSCSFNVPTGMCDRSQFVGECIKNYMAQCRGQPPQQPPQRVCAQVITPAVAPSGECRNFPTPCEVPGNWRVVSSCPISTVPPVTTATPAETPIATATQTSTATSTAAPTTTTTPTSVATATAPPTTVPTTTAPTPTPTTIIQTALRSPTWPFTLVSAQEGERCSLQVADSECSRKWDDQSRYANCGQVRESCDKDAFMKSCQEEVSKGREKYLSQIDAQCQDRYENEKLRIEMMCSEMEDRIDTCNEQSKLACDDLDEEYESCIALAPKKQEKLREAVQNIARDMCEFSKYKPKLVQERVEDLSPSATIPVAIAVKEKLSEDQLSQLKKVIVSLGEPNQIGNLAIYKAKIRAENFGNLKKLSFVLDAQLDSIARSVEAGAQTITAKEAKKSELAPDVPTTIAALEAVKESVSEDFQPLVSAQEGKIADSADSVTKIEEDLSSRGLAYKLKWFLGMGADSELKDSEKLSGEAKSLAASEESLKKIAEQISDLSTKAALLEQANEMGKLKDSLEKMSLDKKNNAAGILSFLKVFGGK